MAHVESGSPSIQPGPGDFSIQILESFFRVVDYVPKPFIIIFPPKGMGVSRKQQDNVQNVSRLAFVPNFCEQIGEFQESQWVKA